MIEEITRANYREFPQRYEGTYGFLESKSGKKLLVSVDRIEAAYTIVTDIKGNNYQLNSDTGCTLEFTQVPAQWFEVAKGVIVYVTRRAERQWKRGVCSANTTIMAPRRHGQSLYQVAVDARKVSQIFYPEDDSTAFDDCTKTNCGLWSKLFAWSEDSVYVKDMVIGKVDHKAKTIKLDDPELFSQEMRDALVRSNSDYKVVND